MGLLQAGYRTYERQANRVGVIEEGKEPLTPVAHAIANAQIEITLSSKGIFQKAEFVGKESTKTIIPVTIESSNRTGDNSNAHPLCDQLRYLAAFGGDKFARYTEQLQQWATSEFSHPKIMAVQNYVLGGSIVADLAASGMIRLDKQGNPAKGDTDFAKYLVRWLIIPAPEGVRSACWEDTTLFDSFIAFYAGRCASLKREICLVSGQQDMVCEMHPKGVVASSYGAKLVSANDNAGFTYRGRFAEAQQAYSIGYIASQKAHLALRWVSANHGVIVGGRTFLCWSPEGVTIPEISFLPPKKETVIDEPVGFINYQKSLLETLSGYRRSLKDTDDVVIAALDAATTGRLSVTYFNQLKGSDFLERIEHWYSSFCWNTRYAGVNSPPLKEIAECAFGTERKGRFEIDDKVLRESIQRLLHCLVDRCPIPFDMVQALVSKASTPLAYTANGRETLLFTACAVVRKHHNDRFEKEEWHLALDSANQDRSYLFGRLLAVIEQVERATYDPQETREPNAIRMQSVFTQRPFYAWKILEEKLNPYFARLAPGLRAYYKNMIGEIVDHWDLEDPALKEKLEDTYLLGYYHQRSDLFRKKEKSPMGGNNDEHTQE